uniref:Reverse transcriptase domain-containing protein n=1 Tax=Tanacetum cinerariifolium TaxID=118510 RepID=A0A6L2K7Z8_TANCI|nr:hypothetical protein [Tanacetum cinerariifolium]
MVDQRTIAELLRAPTEGYTEAIVVPPILAEQFKLKHSLINMMTSDQFFRLEKDNPHDYIRWGSPPVARKRPSRSILTWEDLVSKFTMNSFPLKKNKSPDANSSSFEIAKLTHAVNQQTSAVTIAMTAILKQFQTTPPLASVKAVEEICVTCGGAHLYYQCLAAGGNTFLVLRDNIQGYVAAAAVNYNQGNSVYHPLGVANQIRPSSFAQPNVQNNQNQFSQPQGYNRGNNFNQDQSYQAPTQQNQVVPLSELEKVKRMNEANMKAMQTQINNVKNELRNEMKNSIQASIHLPSNTIANPKGELKAITTRSGIVLDGHFVPIHPPFINSEEDERVEETLTDQDLAEYTIKVPPLLVQKSKPPSQRNFVVHQRGPLHPNIPYPSRMSKQKQQEKDEKMLKALLSNKEKLLELANTPLNENCSAVILKKLPKKLGDPGKFLIPCSFKMILRYGDERMTLNMRHDTSSYSNQPQKESINMINIYDDSSEDFLENLFETNHQCGNLIFSSHPILASPEVKDDVFNPEGVNVLPEKLLDLDSTKNLHPPHHINPLSGRATSSSPNHLLEEFADELALITIHSEYDDDLPFDIESDLKEIEYLLNHNPIKDIDSILNDSIDEDNLVDLNDNLADTIPEMFTKEHAPDYSSPPLYDEYDDDLFEVESDTEYVYDDPFYSKGEKIKESKLLIDELDLPSDFLPSSKYDSFLSEDFSKVDALPSTNNEDKVFNLGILIQENLFEVITRVAPDKKLAISHAFLIPEDFDPTLYELHVFKEVPRSKTLLSFSSKNKEKVFKPGIHTSEGVHPSLIQELSHQGYKFFKINQILKSPMEIFLFSHEEDIHILDVPCLHFYPP